MSARRTINNEWIARLRLDYISDECLNMESSTTVVVHLSRDEADEIAAIVEEGEEMASALDGLRAAAEFCCREGYFMGSKQLDEALRIGVDALAKWRERR